MYYDSYNDRHGADDRQPVLAEWGLGLTLSFNGTLVYFREESKGKNKKSWPEARAEKMPKAASLLRHLQ